MPGMDGIQATRHLTRPGTRGPRVLILTTFDLDEYVYDALRAGASGFLLKDVTAERLFDAVRVIAAGDALLGPTVTRRLIAEFATLHRQPDALPKATLATLTPCEVQVLYHRSTRFRRLRRPIPIRDRHRGRRGASQDGSSNPVALTRHTGRVAWQRWILTQRAAAYVHPASQAARSSSRDPAVRKGCVIPPPAGWPGFPHIFNALGLGQRRSDVRLQLPVRGSTHPIGFAVVLGFRGETPGEDQPVCLRTFAATLDRDEI